MSLTTAQKRIAVLREAQLEWSGLSVERRIRALLPLRRAIARHADEIVKVVGEEVGKPPLDALTGDLMVVLEHLRFCERRAASLLRPQKKGKPPLIFRGSSFFELREPHGVVLAISPWNYPFQLSVVPLATALFAGNAVLLKCSERTPRTAELIAGLCREAGVPDNLVQVSCEGPEQAAQLLEAGPDFLFFTGSSRSGRAIAQRAAALMIPSLLELGGKDAALVFSSSNLERAVNGLVYGSFSNAGQVCVGSKRIYVQRPVYDDFLQRFLARMGELRIGAREQSDLGDVRFDFVKRTMREQIEDAVMRGAKLHGDWRPDGDIVKPAVLTGVPGEARFMVEETFGPIVSIAPFEDERQAIECANSSEFALSASVWTGDLTQGKRMASRIRAGSCVINDVICNGGNPEVAFGGVGASGHGRYHGAEGLFAFSRVKTVMMAQNRRRTEFHWFPLTARTYAILRKLLLMRHNPVGLWARVRASMKISLLFLFVASGLYAQADSPSGSLAVEVRLLPNAHGLLAYLVFSGASGFPDTADRAARRGFVPVTSGAKEANVNVGFLPPGRYAVSVYLDQNANGKLDRDWLGIPKEPAGASRNPRNLHRAPNFEECSFLHGQTPQTISINLVSR